MSLRRLSGFSILAFAAVLLAGPQAGAQVLVQCPGDVTGDAIPDYCMSGGPPNSGGNCPGSSINPEYDPNIQCMHLSGGDGFATMADGRLQYIFSFADLTGTPAVDAMEYGTLRAAWPAPTIMVDEGKQFYLTLTNVGMVIRPDLFDPHTVHFHGFPQSSTVFDGLPESGLSINMGASLTYFYELHDPGTYMYHCHVEATEHMQMGMLGNLYVKAAQNNLPAQIFPSNGFVHTPWDEDTQTGNRYAYNDGDGSTAYDKEYPIQLGSFDPEFHDASLFVQPLPFAMMFDTYPMINGRGYPDTINPDPLPGPAENGFIESQPMSSLIEATAGQRVLLRLSNLNITDVHTLSSPSIPMEVVGIDAKQLLADDGITKLYYNTNSVTMGGGMSADVILDTTGVPAGEYYLYAANLQYLANNDEARADQEYGGMMTKIVINDPAKILARVRRN